MVSEDSLSRSCSPKYENICHIALLFIPFVCTLQRSTILLEIQGISFIRADAHQYSLRLILIPRDLFIGIDIHENVSELIRCHHRFQCVLVISLLIYSAKSNGIHLRASSFRIQFLFSSGPSRSSAQCDLQILIEFFPVC
jgi:hypothetical protein